MTPSKSSTYKFRSHPDSHTCHFSIRTSWNWGLKILFSESEETEMEDKTQLNKPSGDALWAEIEAREALRVCLACLTPTCLVFPLALCSLLSSTLHLAMPEIAEFSILKVRLRSPMENFKEKARQKLFCVRGYFDIFIYDGKLSIFTDRFHIFWRVCWLH